ncbi:hypothetical protein GIB67_038870, partial [Kingdonia uniflora]
AASARNSVNRENLMALACVGRDNMDVVRHRLVKEMNLKSDAQVPRSDGFIKAHTKSDKTIYCPTFVEKIIKCECLNPVSKPTSVTDFVAKAPNLYLNKKCILNGFSKANVVCGEVAFVDPATPIHQGILGQGFYKILLYEIYSPNCPLVKPDSYVSTLGEVQERGLGNDDWLLSKIKELGKSIKIGCRLQVADCRLQIADVGHFCFRSITGTFTLNLTWFMSQINMLLITLSSRTTLFREDKRGKDTMALVDFLSSTTSTTIPMALCEAVEDHCESSTRRFMYFSMATEWAKERAEYVQRNLDPKHPNFVKPSQVSGTFMLSPPKFCNEYLSKEDVIFTLVNKNEEPFTVRFSGRKFRVGWKAFSNDNNLVERDALVFKLVKPAKFLAYIIRAYGSSGVDGGLGLKNSGACKKPNISRIYALDIRSSTYVHPSTL